MALPAWNTLFEYPTSHAPILNHVHFVAFALAAGVAASDCAVRTSSRMGLGCCPAPSHQKVGYHQVRRSQLMQRARPKPPGARPPMGLALIDRQGAQACVRRGRALRGCEVISHLLLVEEALVQMATHIEVAETSAELHQNQENESSAIRNWELYEGSLAVVEAAGFGKKVPQLPLHLCRDWLQTVG